MTTIPKICLNMIVKDESHIIEERLTALYEKIKFDYYVISDTGSTDNTKELMKSFFDSIEVNGEFYDHEWKDFGTNRSQALECAYNKSEYLLIFDADDIVIGNFQLPIFMEYDKYNLKFGEECLYYRPLLINNQKKWCFKGVLHEYLEPVEFVPLEINLDGDYYIISGKTGHRNKDPKKYIKDAKILEKAFEETFNTDYKLACRYSFYCAQSFKDAEYIEDAIKWYEKTILLDGWNQEKYYSCIVLAEMYKNNNQFKAIEYMLKSIQFDNERLEGVVMACELCVNNNLHTFVNYLHEKYSNLGIPNNKLFLYRHLYNDYIHYYNSISCFYLNKYDEGYDSIKKIMKNNILDDVLMDQTIKNIFFYKDQINNDETMDAFNSLSMIVKKKKGENKELAPQYKELYNYLNEKHFTF